VTSSMWQLWFLTSCHSSAPPLAALLQGLQSRSLFIYKRTRACSVVPMIMHICKVHLRGTQCWTVVLFLHATSLHLEQRNDRNILKG
jgi:hypothetical protein